MHLLEVQLHPERYPVDDRYPFNQAIWRTTTAIAFHRPVTILVGENGTGKSTLLRALARRCGITIWEYGDTQRAVQNPYADELHQYLDVRWAEGPVPGSFFGSETFRDFSKIVDEWAAADPGQLRYFGGRSLLTLSHGQSLMSYFTARYERRGLYLLDEPETALSPRSQVKLLRLLDRMSRAGHAQFILATHSPLLLACPGAEILSFDALPLQPIAYEDTEHYRLYRAFLEDPNALLQGDGP